MVDHSELLRVPAFADLPDEQISWFLSQAQELHLKAGDSYLRAGDPANVMFVILEGQVEIRGEIGGETVAFPIDAGNVTGALPFSRMKQFTVGGRAIVDTRALKVSAGLFSDLVPQMPELAKRLVGLMSDRIRETTRMEQQRERLASLGKLSAGLTLEINKPAPSPQRATTPTRTQPQK